MVFFSLSQATASQSSTAELTPSVRQFFRRARMSGNLEVLSSWSGGLRGGGGGEGGVEVEEVEEEHLVPGEDIDGAVLVKVHLG